jgi:hypothetical protein
MSLPEGSTGAGGRTGAGGGAGRGGDARGDGPGATPGGARFALPPQRYGRYVALLAIVILVLITINTIATKPNGAGGLAPGTALPPFAVPLALSSLNGDADIATRPDEGAAGRIPACDLRGPRILNVCELYEHLPLVLALFVDGGSCPQILGDMQKLSGEFPHVNFAAVAIRGGRAELRRLVRSRGLTFPVGVDSDGSLAALYKVASCPQVTFALPGGKVQSPALLSRPAPAVLRSRVQELVAVAQAQDRGASGSAG